MNRMNQRFSLRPMLRYLFVTGFFAAGAFGSARAACPDVSNSYSANLFNTITKGVALANTSCTAEDEPHGGSCNSFVGMVVDKTYGQPDLKTRGGYLSVAQLNAYLPASTTWTFMGPAARQDVLNQAQTDANNGAPVIAISKDHEALLLPSPVLVLSRGFANLCVPMSAAHFSTDPSLNYASGPLSLSWALPDGVSIWERTGPLLLHSS
jgi:hypothetical protein